MLAVEFGHDVALLEAGFGGGTVLADLIDGDALRLGELQILGLFSRDFGNGDAQPSGAGLGRPRETAEAGWRKSRRWRLRARHARRGHQQQGSRRDDREEIVFIFLVLLFANLIAWEISVPLGSTLNRADR